jgi:hypothetical protein
MFKLSSGRKAEVMEMNTIIRENAMATGYPGVSSNYRVHNNAFVDLSMLASQSSGRSCAGNFTAKPHVTKAQNSPAYYYNYDRPVISRSRGAEYRKRVRRSARFSKIIITLSLILMLAAAFIAGGFLFGQDASGIQTPVYETVRVMPGDTLWDIAVLYAPDDISIRAYIGEICKANDLDDSSIQAGMVLSVPV